jgi:hypothetical protein
MLKRLLTVFWCLMVLLANAQQEDSAVQRADTVRPQAIRPRPRPIAIPVTAVLPDSLVKDSVFPSFRMDTLVMTASRPSSWEQPAFRFERHPYFRFANPGRYTISVRQWNGKEAAFYALVALLIFFAVIRNGFNRYINDLMKTFFRTTIRQRQIKDQLLQSPLPSLLLNIFFVLSASLFAALVLQHFRLGTQFPFWILYLYCLGAVAAIYIGKFLILKFVGWLVGASDAANTYIFVIFSANKIMGIALLPVLLVLGFNQGIVSQVAMTVGFVIVCGLFVYRFFLTYVSIQRQLAVSFFHFLLYLAAFEIAPLLVINKLLLHFFS